jgi:hypothetical protein
VTAAFRAVGSVAASVWSSVRSTASRAVSAIAGFFRTLPGRIAGAIGTIPTIIGRAMARAANAVKDWVGDIVSAILSIPSRVAGVGARIASKITSGVSGIDLSPGFNVPGIPFFQHGGIVTRPTLAVIGEAGPEAVVPLGRSMGSPLGGVAAGTVVNVAMDLRGAVISSDRQFEEMVVRSFNKAAETGRVHVRGRSL